jgi:hypothetical protein
LVLRLGARLLVLVPSSRRKHYKLDIIFYFILLAAPIDHQSLSIIATAGDDLLLAAPFDNHSLTWKTTVQPPRVVPVENNVQPPRVVQNVPVSVANNVHRLRTKE